MKSSIGHLVRKLVSSPSRWRAGVFLLSFAAQGAFAQQYIASTSTVVNSEALATSYVNDKDNAIGASDSQVATISASGLVVNVLPGVSVTYSSDAALVLNFGSLVPAGKTTYVRINSLTQTGLNLDLSSLLNALGLLENETISVSSDGGATTRELVRNAAGDLFIAITPTNAYSSVTVGLNFDNSTSQLLGVALGRITMTVDYAANYENLVLGPCDAASFAFAGVNPHAAGIALTLTDALQNPERAIDGDVSAGNFSLLQNGAVAVASTVSQTVFLGKTSPGTNEVVATISKPAALLNLGVLENITFQAYLGETAVGVPHTAENLLVDLDLLTLFGNDGLATVRFVPGGAYDRIKVTSVTILNANLFTGLRIHELSSRPPVVMTGGVLPVTRVGDPLNVSITTAVAGNGQPGFSLNCGNPADYTFALSGVAQNARVLAGSLPNTITLSPNGTLTGTPTTGQDGTYDFDIETTNNFGQTDTTVFRLVIEKALPVTLVSFKALSEGQTAALSWTTSEETNSDRFDVERSQNGKNWVKIGSLSSHKESKVNQYYSFADAAPLRGDNYYRLKMVDRDETFAYSHIEHLNFDGIALVYPNPVSASQNLTFNVGDWSKVSQVKVVNAAGKVVFEASNALLSGLNARNLVAGAYVVQVTHVDGTVSSQKFVRQ
ncbi:T9SS type A sorting domain-containing protein [Dyadobacter sp. BHUBP1]|uniref:T9SS type A sorting domain-containing protein n=1 Tax=Dyadobacter sp. BHUBP1 TaxID=3424178 RepID=UPI003D32862A